MLVLTLTKDNTIVFRDGDQYVGRVEISFKEPTRKIQLAFHGFDGLGIGRVDVTQFRSPIKDKEQNDLPK